MSPRIKQFIIEFVTAVALFAMPFVIIYIIYGLGGFQ
jgi:hypothetical protein